jgi:hypothetical protein
LEYDAENNMMDPTLDVNTGCDHTHTHTHTHTLEVVEIDDTVKTNSESMAANEDEGMDWMDYITVEDQESEKNIIENMTKLIILEDQESEKNIMENKITLIILEDQESEKNIMEEKRHPWEYSIKQRIAAWGGNSGGLHTLPPWADMKIDNTVETNFESMEEDIHTNHTNHIHIHTLEAVVDDIVETNSESKAADVHTNHTGHNNTHTPEEVEIDDTVETNPRAWRRMYTLILLIIFILILTHWRRSRSTTP